MRLDRVEVRKLSLPLKAPFETSVGRLTEKRFLLVSVFADGVAGHAECVADEDPFYLPETNTTALHVLEDFLVPIAFGLDIAHPGDLAPALERVRGHPMAKAALEMAVWELQARREGVPLYRLLGDGAAPSKRGSRWASSPTTGRSATWWRRRSRPGTGGSS